MSNWAGVDLLLSRAGESRIPEAKTAVFVGSEFDSLAGRGGDDGTPVRKTPWGEIAWQLGEAQGLALVAEHERTATAPGGDVVNKMLPAGRPVLILLDELMNYVNRNRKSGLAGQLYTFLHNLSEVARTRDDVVLAVSIPASEIEMTAEDHADHERFKKVLDRVGKPVFLAAEAEAAEIIRRRLFEWQGLPPAASETVAAYADWMLTHRHQLPSWFPVDTARDAFAATYPFHPSVLSVFERKWRGLPRFQETRGILRLLALWVARVYKEGYEGLPTDPVITLGTAPLHDPMFRVAVFNQLGEDRLETAVTTDVAGKDHAHALRLDAEGTAEVKKARLHRKVATSIFFESNGGQQKAESSLAEVRLAVAEPDLDIGNVEQCLEALTDTCYYLTAKKNRYRFSFQPNLNKLLADRRATVSEAAAHEQVRSVVHKVFAAGPSSPASGPPGRRRVERVYFPDQSNQIPDRPVVTLVIAAPEMAAADPGTRREMELMTRDHGASSRTFKNALLWCVAEDPAALQTAARKVLAWEEIDAEAETLRLDEAQRKQLAENLGRARRVLREAVWCSYKNVFYLDDSNALYAEDLGRIHSSQSPSLVDLILERFGDKDQVVEAMNASYLVRHWAPALPEWSTRAVRDVFFASPKYPRLLDPESVKLTIARGVESGLLAYVAKKPDGSYDPFLYQTALQPEDVEIADDVYVIRKADAEVYLAGQQPAATPPVPPPIGPKPDDGVRPPAPSPPPPPEGEVVPGFRWTGEITPLKWMNFYTKVLSHFANSGGLRLTLTVEAKPDVGVTKQRLEETKIALRELGLVETFALLGDEGDE